MSLYLDPQPAKPVGASSKLECGLYGPIMGDLPVKEDEVRHVVRPGRQYTSRTVGRPTRTVTVVIVRNPSGGPGEVLATIYGGPAAPREPNDPSLRNPQTWVENSYEIRESHDFWSTHALSHV